MEEDGTLMPLVFRWLYIDVLRSNMPIEKWINFYDKFQYENCMDRTIVNMLKKYRVE
jgi:hypothetical protein